MDETTTRTALPISRRAAAAGMLAMALPVAASAQGVARAVAPAAAALPQLRVYCAQMAVEVAPIHLAVRSLYGENAIVHNGGVQNLIGSDRIADLAGNGETQMLRQSVKEPGMRVIMTIAEGHYPIVARLGQGITKLADLKGKRVLNINNPATTSTYFLHKMLKSVGLDLNDVTMIQRSLGKIGASAKAREIDAVAMWEPDSEQAVRAWRDLGEDVVIFSGKKVFYERYNLHTTADTLADPAKRRAVIAMMRAIIDATDEINGTPLVAQQAQAIVARSGGLYTPAEVTAGWPNVHFVASFEDDIVDTLTEEDVWLAERDKRPARSRAQMATMVDRSLYDEVLRTGRTANRQRIVDKG